MACVSQSAIFGEPVTLTFCNFLKLYSYCLDKKKPYAFPSRKGNVDTHVAYVLLGKRLLVFSLLY